MKIRVWFRHRKGPYSQVVQFRSVERAEAFYYHGSYFISASSDLTYKPPGLEEWEREHPPIVVPRTGLPA